MSGITTVEYLNDGDSQVISCDLNKYNLKPDTVTCTFKKLILDGSEDPYYFKHILDVLDDRRFEVFLSVLEDNNIQTKEVFSEFMNVIKEHCLDKNIRDYATIKKTWKEYKDSIQ